MRYYRTTSTGRRISAEPCVCTEPEMKRLIALVLHLAEQLHTEEQAEARNGADEAREDHQLESRAAKNSGP